MVQQECSLCGCVLQRDNGIRILCKEEREIGICQNCEDDIYRNNMRYNVDVMIVPVSENSFAVVKKERKYIIPAYYLGKHHPKMIAFYRGGDISAITDIALVKRIDFNVDIASISNLLKAGIGEKWSKKNDFANFELEEILPLSKVIERNLAPPVQNRSHKTFRRFAAARELKDLYGK